MSSLRESGQIEQDADVILLLYPADPDNNASGRVLKVAKNKEGERFTIDLAFDGATQSLVPDEGRKVQQKLVNEGRRARQQHQTVMPGFTNITETDKEALPF